MDQTRYDEVGAPIPAGDHSVSVCLPTWEDTVNYKRGEPQTLGRMQTGYPRFFMPLVVRKLAKQLEQAFALPSECSLLVRSATVAEACRTFLVEKTGNAARVVSLRRLDSRPGSQISMVLFPPTSASVATYFWQHTGLGLSSRFTERYLAMLESTGTLPPLASEDAQILPRSANANEDICSRYASPKRVLRRRIADLMTHNGSCAVHQCRKSSLLPLTEDDVFLYPTGMSAIWSAHQLLLSAIGLRKSVCFGFPYTDTLKILRKWGPGCYFYPDGDEASIDKLEAMLASLSSESPILALFTEFPSNPLLRSVNLPRLRALADTYDIMIVVDDTVGNFVNVDVLPFADIVVSSLTKIFSGCADVMGGSLALNPLGKHYAVMKHKLQHTWEDVYFEEDAQVMELNSRNFCARIARIDLNAEAVCDYLRRCTDIITEVYYPKWQTRALYDACRSTFAGGHTGGFGGLFSLLFASPQAAHAFFDALACAKGPSLGTNFTLACPYALFAHWEELDWAEQHGVPRDIVRVSVGVEDTGRLLDAFAVAVRAARGALRNSLGTGVITSTKL